MSARKNEHTPRRGGVTPPVLQSLAVCRRAISVDNFRLRIGRDGDNLQSVQREDIGQAGVEHALADWDSHQGVVQLSLVNLLGQAEVEHVFLH